MGAVLGACVSLLGLGLVMGFSPTVYAYVIRLLTRSPAAAAAIRWITVGLAIGSTILLLVFRVVDPDTITALIRADTERLLVRRWVDLTAGSLLMVAGLVVCLRLGRRARPHPSDRLTHEDPPWRAKGRAGRIGRAEYTSHAGPAGTAEHAGPAGPAEHAGTAEHAGPAGHAWHVGRAGSAGRGESPVRMVAFGTVNAVAGVSGMATMYVVGRVITAASHDLLVQVILFGVFLAALASQYLLVAWAWSRLPRLAGRISALFARLMRIDTGPWLAAGLLLAGAVFLAMGLWLH